MPLNHLPIDQTLVDHAKRFESLHMRDLFEADPKRFDTYSVQAPEVFLDFSKNRIDDEVLQALITLAEQAELGDKIEAMFTGEAINHTENRAVLHTALRSRNDDPILVDGENVKTAIQATKDKMYDFVEQIHNGEVKGYTDKAFDTLVSIGIGGSFLGPLLVNEALSPYAKLGLTTHFVANIDGTDLSEVLKQIDPETTLFLVQSKSFKTQETLENAKAARAWFLDQGASEADIAKHFLAVSANVPAAEAFGLHPDNVFPMWDWVGGRYSLWSAIGFPIIFQCGKEPFEALLEGAGAMDQHFRSSDFKENVPVLLGLLGVWYNNYLGAHSHAVLPYEQYLQRLPDYLQQLDMESNGKSANLDGQALTYETGPIIWGDIGANGQHAYHQLMHQGTKMIPADFIACLETHNPVAEHHSHLFANCLAQSQALMQGKTEAEAKAELIAAGKSEDEAAFIAKHKIIAGNKPTNTLILEKLTPKSLGALIAMYEQKVFVQGVIWNLNSFDQWGVELGKILETGIYPKLTGAEAAEGLDASTAGLIEKFKAAQK